MAADGLAKMMMNLTHPEPVPVPLQGQVQAQVQMQGDAAQAAQTQTDAQAQAQARAHAEQEAEDGRQRAIVFVNYAAGELEMHQLRLGELLRDATGNGLASKDGEMRTVGAAQLDVYVAFRDAAARAPELVADACAQPTMMTRLLTTMLVRFVVCCFLLFVVFCCCCCCF